MRINVKIGDILEIDFDETEETPEEVAQSLVSYSDVPESKEFFGLVYKNIR